MTLWYIGHVTQSQVDQIVATAKAHKLVDRIGMLVANPGSVRCEREFERYIMLRYDFANEDQVRNELATFYDALVADMVFDASNAPRVTPRSQPLVPHMSLFQHKQSRDCEQHYKGLQQIGAVAIIDNDFQSMRFGPVYLAIRDKNTKQIRRVVLAE
jgi:hypothetical protein